MMKNFSFMIRTLCCAIFFYVYLLQGMEYTKEYVLRAETDELVWDLVLKNGVALFDYKMIGYLAATNRGFKTILCKAAQQRKEYLNDHDYSLNNVQHNEWHRYGSVRGKIAFHDIDNTVKYVWLERQCLLNPRELPLFTLRENFYGKLPHQPKPFFNNKGSFCFYGYGEIENLLDKHSGAIVEYSLCSNEKLKIMECVMHIKKGKPSITLRILLEFPYLLKAFLDSQCVYEAEVRDEHDKKNKVFAIEGVIIPKNYKFHQQYFSQIIYSSFDALPAIVRKKIIALYQKQQIKHKKEKGLGCFGK